MAAHQLIASATEAAPGITSGQRGFVFVIAVVALAALGFAYVLVREVLRADQGTPRCRRSPRPSRKARPRT